MPIIFYFEENCSRTKRADLDEQGDATSQRSMEKLRATAIIVSSNVRNVPETIAKPTFVSNVVDAIRMHDVVDVTLSE